MGLLYLVQERGLKSRSPRRFYYLGPSLERCDTIGGASVAVGFGFLTLAIVTGVLWSHASKGSTGPRTPRVERAHRPSSMVLLAARSDWLGGRVPPSTPPAHGRRFHLPLMTIFAARVARASVGLP